MKKLVLLAVLLIVTGCGKKSPTIDELTCTKTFSDAISSVVYENKYTYEDGVLNAVTMDTSLKFTSDGIDYLDTFKTYAEATNNEYNKKDGVKSALTTTDTTINLKVDYTISKMTDTEVENNNFKNELNSFREKLEKDGYTCK